FQRPVDCISDRQGNRRTGGRSLRNAAHKCLRDVHCSRLCSRFDFLSKSRACEVEHHQKNESFHETAIPFHTRSKIKSASWPAFDLDHPRIRCVTTPRMMSEIAKAVCSVRRLRIAFLRMPSS